MPFDETVALLDDVVQVLSPHHLDWYRAAEAAQHFVDCLQARSIGGAFGDNNRPWQLINFQHPGEELRGARFIAGRNPQACSTNSAL